MERTIADDVLDAIEAAQCSATDARERLMESTEKPSLGIGSAQAQGNLIISLDAHQKDIIRTALVDTARKLLGIPYQYGVEWANFSTLPVALDCSEMIEGIYHYNGLKMPDGSQNQFDFTIPTGNPLPGDLAFFGRGGKPTQVYHVGMVFDEFNIIEARGFDPKASFETGKVILRQKIKWSNYCNFLGFRNHPKLT